MAAFQNARLDQLVDSRWASFVTGFMNCIPDAAILVHENRILAANTGFETLFGYPLEMIKGHSLDLLIPEPYRHQHHRWMQSFSSKAHALPMADRRVLQALHRSGKEIPVSISISNIEAEGLSFQVAVVRDVSLEVAALKQAQSLAEQDVLTGVWNRLHASKEIQSRIRHKQPFTLLFLDLDNFKPINDAHGHASGDQVLKVVAKRLSKQIKAGDVLARIGGDEFIILLSGVTDRKVIRRIANDIADALSQSINITDQVVFTGTSIGASIYPDSANDEATLIHLADQAMYQAKQTGQDFCFDPALISPDTNTPPMPG